MDVLYIVFNWQEPNNKKYVTSSVLSDVALHTWVSSAELMVVHQRWVPLLQEDTQLLEQSEDGDMLYPS